MANEYPHYMDVMPDELKEMWEQCTEKQKLFIVSYSQSGNARMSSIKAGYSKNCAKEQGYENLTKPHIKPIVDWVSEYIIDNALDTSISTASERMKILTDMSRATIADYTNDSGDIEIQQEGSNPANVKELKNAYDEQGNMTTTLKMYSSVDAIKELNKMQGSYEADRIRHVDKDDNDIKPLPPVVIECKEMSKEDLEDIGFVKS